jgi:hypothetical protein
MGVAPQPRTGIVSDPSGLSTIPVIAQTEQICFGVVIDSAVSHP